MDVAVVILCWRERTHLPALLAALASQSGELAMTVVVCHNEADAGWRTPVPPGLDLCEIWTGGNLGYGGGNNHAIRWLRRRADPRWILVLNSDVVPAPGTLAAWIRWGDRHPQVAVVGAVHEDPVHPGTLLHGGCRYDPALTRIRPNREPGGRIDYVHGAAMLLRTADLEGDAPIPEHGFLFFEEIGLARRLAERGRALGLCPEARVVHHEGASRRRGDDDFTPAVGEYFENLNALRHTRDYHRAWLPVALAVRLLAKPALLLWRGDRERLVFWRLAMGDFLAGRVRRFPFMAGWSTPGADTLVDADLPRRPD